MKQIIYPIIMIVVMLSGCAKVTQDAAPCTGPKPTAPVVPDQVITSYGTVTPSVVDPSTVSLKWTGPNNFVYNGLTLSLDLYSGTNSYGTYTCTAYNSSNCVSATTSFQVSATLSLPCTPTSYYYTLSTTDGASEEFTYDPYFSYNSTYPRTGYEYQNNSVNNIQLYIYVQGNSSPQANTVFTLDSTGRFGSGTAYVQFGNYVSISGKMYDAPTGGSIDNILVFCSAKFKNTQTGAYVTLTGSVATEY